MEAEVKIIHKLKKLILLILSISIASLYLMFSNSTEIEASSNDNNSINYLKLKNKSTSLSTIYSEKYQTRIHNQINKQKKLKEIIKSFYLVSVQMKFLEVILGFIKKNFIV